MLAACAGRAPALGGSFAVEDTAGHCAIWRGREDLAGVLAEVVRYQRGGPASVRIGAEGSRAFVMVSESTDGGVVYHAAGRAGEDVLGCRSLGSEQEFRAALKSVELEEEDPDDQACGHTIDVIVAHGQQIVLLENMWWVDGEAHDLLSHSDILDHGAWERTVKTLRVGPGRYVVERSDAEGEHEHIVEAPDDLSDARERELVGEVVRGQRPEVVITTFSNDESPAMALRYTRIEPPEGDFNIRFANANGFGLRSATTPDGHALRIESDPSAKTRTTGRKLFLHDDCGP